jgi:hypothetical protein
MTGDAEAVSTIRSGKRQFEDVRLRFRALWRRLGAGLDGGGSLADADAWYCILEGTAEVAVAESQARALTDLLAFHALRGDREILLCVDEFSAVARRLPIWRLYERARSLGLAVQVSAQSWEGLAETDDQRQRVAATAEGGIWLLRTPRPSPVVELAGNLPSVETSRRLAGSGPWEDEGLSRAGTAPVLDGDLVRRLEIGQVCYVYRNGVTFLQIKRLTGRQAAIGRGGPGDGVGVVGGGMGGVAGVPAGRAAEAGAVSGAASGADGGEAPTLTFPVLPAFPVSGAVPSVAGTAAWVAGAGGKPGAPAPGHALPDVSEVLDEAFGERRG